MSKNPMDLPDGMVSAEPLTMSRTAWDALLAASQAECAELREALYGFTRWMSPEGSRIEAFVDCAHEMREARNLLSRPTGTQDALRDMLRSTCEAAFEGLNIETGWSHVDVDRIVARVLGEVSHGRHPHRGRAQEGGEDMTLQSPCCGAAVRTREARLDRGAWWYVCSKCGKPCDPVPSAPGKAMEGE